MRGDDLLRSGECFPDYDPHQHLETILDMLKVLLRWRDIFKDRIQEAKKNGDSDAYIEGCIEGTYAHIGYCHTAVAALAPMFEGMFAHEFMVLRLINGDKVPDGEHRRCKKDAEVFWNPKLSVNRKDELEQNVQQGSVQILTALNLIKRFPPKFKSATEALFTYRNRSLHDGYEWPKEKRVKFKKLIDGHGWGDWFSWARENGDPWIAYMNDEFIRECFNVAGDSVVAFEAIRMEQIAKMPLDPSPAWVADYSRLFGHDSLSPEIPISHPIRWK
jgi:hypothetical protein